MFKKIERVGEKITKTGVFPIEDFNAGVGMESYYVTDKSMDILKRPVLRFYRFSFDDGDGSPSIAQVEIGKNSISVSAIRFLDGDLFEFLKREFVSTEGESASKMIEHSRSEGISRSSEAGNFSAAFESIQGSDSLYYSFASRVNTGKLLVHFFYDGESISRTIDDVGGNTIDVASINQIYTKGNDVEVNVVRLLNAIYYSLWENIEGKRKAMISWMRDIGLSENDIANYLCYYVFQVDNMLSMNKGDLCLNGK